MTDLYVFDSLLYYSYSDYELDYGSGTPQQNQQDGEANVKSAFYIGYAITQVH